MTDLFFYSCISFAVAIAAFVYGIVNLFKNKTPLYFKILICAVGCFTVSQLSNIINVWCDVTELFSIGIVAYFGCNLFLLSANHGALDRIVDDGKSSSKAKKIALIAPCVMAIFMIIAYVEWKDVDVFCAIVWTVTLMPVLPASYFNLKHILLPIDPFEFLRATRICNYAALLFYILLALLCIFSAGADALISGILLLILSALMLVLALGAKRGAEKWGI